MPRETMPRRRSARSSSAAAARAVAATTRFGIIAVAPLLPLLQEDLGLSGTAAGVLFGLPILLMGVFAIPGGALADRIGPARSVALGVGCIAIGGGLRALAGGLPA